MKKLLQAARLSRLGDASTGLEKQDLECQQYATIGGDEIIATAADTDVSGDVAPWLRPKLGPWLNDPELIDSYDGIIASHIDRLSRNTIHFMRLLQWADEQGKVIITTGEQGIDFSTPVGKLLGYIISWLGEQELAAIKRRSADTQKWLKDNDYLVGRFPYGYRAVPSGDHKTLEPDPEQAPRVREMAEMYLAGNSLTQICEHLDAQDVKPPRGIIWSQQSVSQILRNPGMTGKRKDASGRIVLRYPAILDTATQKKVIAKMDAAPTRRGAATGDTALLTGILKCGKCKRNMYRIKTRDGFFYRCAGTAREPSTCRNMLELADMDSRVSNSVMETYGGSPHLIVTDIPGDGHDAELEDVKAELADLPNLGLSDDEEDAERRRLRAERDQIAALPNEPARRERRPDPSGKTVADVWLPADTAGRRQWLITNKWTVAAHRDDDREIMMTIDAGGFASERPRGFESQGLSLMELDTPAS